MNFIGTLVGYVTTRCFPIRERRPFPRFIGRFGL